MIDDVNGTVHLISYQVALRSLGALLDAAVAPRVRLGVDVDGVTVVAAGGFGSHHFSWDQLAELAAARRGLRGSERASIRGPLRFSRWQTLLRLAGRALDRAQLPRFALHATIAPPDDPFQYYMEVTVDGQHRLGQTELSCQLAEVEAIRADREGPVQA
jgi:hypothetical protein